KRGDGGNREQGLGHVETAGTQAGAFAGGENTHVHDTRCPRGLAVTVKSAGSSSSVVIVASTMDGSGQGRGSRPRSQMVRSPAALAPSTSRSKESDRKSTRLNSSH